MGIVPQKRMLCVGMTNADVTVIKTGETSYLAVPGKTFRQAVDEIDESWAEYDLDFDTYLEVLAATAMDGHCERI